MLDDYRHKEREREKQDRTSSTEELRPLGQTVENTIVPIYDNAQMVIVIAPLLHLHAHTLTGTLHIIIIIYL